MKDKALTASYYNSIGWRQLNNVYWYRTLMQRRSGWWSWCFGPEIIPEPRAIIWWSIFWKQCCCTNISRMNLCIIFVECLLHSACSETSQRNDEKLAFCFLILSRHTTIDRISCLGWQNYCRPRRWVYICWAIIFWAIILLSCLPTNCWTRGGSYLLQRLDVFRKYVYFRLRSLECRSFVHLRIGHVPKVMMKKKRRKFMPTTADCLTVCFFYYFGPFCLLGQTSLSL